jgi:hypothetical protein
MAEARPGNPIGRYWEINSEDRFGQIKKGAGASPLYFGSDPPITGYSVEVEVRPPREANLMN